MRWEVRALTFGYTQPLATLEDWNAGGSGITAVIGANGSGKSTLLKTLTGLQPALGGEMQWNGQSLLTMPAPERAKILAVVLTDKLMMGGLTAREVVALGRFPYRGEGTHKVQESLERLDIAFTADRPMDTLSDGERQKVAIARALCQDTPLLFLDEPTAFLDFPSKKHLMQLFAEESKRRHIVFSTHDLHLLESLQCEVLEVAGGTVAVHAPDMASEVLQRWMAD